MRDSEWLRFFSPCNPAARALIVAFPHAGAGPAEYASWGPRLPGWLDVCAFVAPGRDTRMGEPPLTSVHRLAEGALAAVQHADRPLVLFGHSLGAWIAYDLACRLVQIGRPPAHLFVSGAVPPHQMRAAQPSTEQEAIEHLRRLRATPEEVLRPGELATLFMPAVKADLEAAREYVQHACPRISVPTTALCGAADPFVDPSGVSTWAEITGPDIETLCFPGGHFFVRESRDAVIAAVTSRVRRAVAPTAGA